MTDYTPSNVGSMKRIVSVIVPVATTITLDIPLDLAEYSRVHCGAEYFSDAIGTAATAGAGTITVQAKSLTAPQGFETISPSSLACTAPGVSIAWTFNTIQVVATPAGVTTATHWRVNIALNEE